MLIVDPQTGITPFNRLKHSPGPARPSNIRDWTERLAWIDKLPDPAPVLRDITFTKLRQFAAETAALEVGELLDISSADKRRTFLLSLINQSKTRCRDELAEMFLIRVRRTQAAAKEKLADLRKRHQGLEESLIAVLSQILVTAQETDADAALGQSIKALFQKRGGVDHLSEQCATVSAWHGDNVLPLLWPIHAQTRSLLFEILDQLEIQSATQDQSLVLAMRRVVKLRRSRRPDIMDPPDLSFASQRWVTFMKEGRGDGVDRKAFEVCVFVYVAHGLQSGDLFVVGSETYSDYRAQLLPWSECAPKLDAYCAAIGRPNTAPAFVEQLKEALTTAAQNVDRGFPDNAELTIDAKGEPHLKRARAAPVPKAMGAFEREIRSRMPERHLLNTGRTIPATLVRRRALIRSFLALFSATCSRCLDMAAIWGRRKRRGTRPISPPLKRCAA